MEVDQHLLVEVRELIFYFSNYVTKIYSYWLKISRNIEIIYLFYGKVFFQVLTIFIEVAQVHLNITWVDPLGVYFEVREGSKITPI